MGEKKSARSRLNELARTALDQGRPAELATRELRLLDEARKARSREESRLWLTLLACAWARDPLNDLVKREAALLAAVALAAGIQAPVRHAAEIDERLAELTRCGALDARGRDLAYRLACGNTPRGLLGCLEALVAGLARNPARRRLSRSGAWHHGEA
jgi:hypothetical protein